MPVQPFSLDALSISPENKTATSREIPSVTHKAFTVHIIGGKPYDNSHSKRLLHVNLHKNNYATNMLVYSRG
jgi:hypothetical protein